MRTSRLAGAALLITLALPLPAAAQPDECVQPELGPPVACVSPDLLPDTPVVPEEPERDPGPALWIGAVFGVAGLAGIVSATGRVRDTEGFEGA